MKQILLGQALVVLTINALSAQIKISGIVKDNKNHPLTGVSITIIDNTLLGTVQLLDNRKRSSHYYSKQHRLQCLHTKNKHR